MFGRILCSGFALFFLCASPAWAAVYTTVQPGPWSSGATWGGAAPPDTIGSGDVVTINHRVTKSSNLKMEGSAQLFVNHIFRITSGNLEADGATTITVTYGVIIIDDGGFTNKTGTVQFNEGAVQLCDGNYKDESSGSPNGTYGTGYIYVDNGNIEAKGVFSPNIDWCIEDGGPVGLPTGENCADASPPGGCTDESYWITRLPVSLNAFSSRAAKGGGMIVSWQTASETQNVGFELQGLIDGAWRPFGEMVGSKGMNSDLPQYYEMTVIPPPGLRALRLVDFDLRGTEEVFGPYRVGATYGEFQPVNLVDWQKVRLEHETALTDRGFQRIDGTERWRRLQQPGGRAAGKHGMQLLGNKAPARSADASGATTHIAVTRSGIQRVTVAALAEAGLDLVGLSPDDVAVTFRGAPVARHIENRGKGLASDAYIEFVGLEPQGDDALYIDANLYQVSLDPAMARPTVQEKSSKIKRPSPVYRAEAVVDRPLMYHPQSRTGDPWIERTVLARSSPASVSLKIPFDGPVESGAATLFLDLTALTELPVRLDTSGEVIPEHNVEIWAGAQGSEPVYLDAVATSGRQHWQVELPLAAEHLAAGQLEVELRFSTTYAFSLVLVDRYGIRYPRGYHGPDQSFAPDPFADGYHLDGFADRDIAAYAVSAAGNVKRLGLKVFEDGGGYAAEFSQPADAEWIWVSGRPQQPSVFTTAPPGDLLAGPAGLVVIADPAFIGGEALEDYLLLKADFDPLVVSTEDIYNSVGFGMALPGALTEYLATREAVHPFSHVQLVGTDCYDRLNYVSSCVSFVPLPTAPVDVTTFTPSQNRLVDLDGDGVGDKAVGQFSVRSEAELATIVGKIWDWQHGDGLAAGRSALLIAEESDGITDFLGQVNRLDERLAWNDTQILDMAPLDIATARSTMDAALTEGRTLTVFSGHSSPTVWAYRKLLTSQTAAALGNGGKPTLMVPLACETTYDSSPSANLLGHQLLYSGDQGAIAISGAAALSARRENERMANYIVDGLNAGRTLGEAVQAGRDALGAVDQTLLDNWLTQGDATLRLAQ
jgi:hypothetical protein